MAKYACESFKCVVYHTSGADLHHIITRKAGGLDERWNLLPVAHAIHNEIHSQGLVRCATKYPAIKEWLISHGWELQELFGRKKWIRLKTDDTNKK